MKKRFFCFLLKKNNGDAAYIGMAVSFVLFSMFISVMIFFYMLWMLEMDTVNNIDLVITTYMKVMETDGCMSDTDKNAMIAELKEFGLNNVQVSGIGTDGTKQTYGNSLTLTVRGDIDITASEESSVSNIIKGLRSWLGDSRLFVYTGSTFNKDGMSKLKNM